jgi:hypothetical protein
VFLPGIGCEDGKHGGGAFEIHCGTHYPALDLRYHKMID